MATHDPNSYPSSRGPEEASIGESRSGTIIEKRERMTQRTNLGVNAKEILEHLGQVGADLGGDGHSNLEVKR
jgi:hypothetical protein